MAKIAIVGAGIGGLALAAMLRDQGRDVVVFDQFDAPRPVGSGLVVQPVGQEVLVQIGALDHALHHGRPVWRMQGHEAKNGKTVLHVDYGPEGGDSFGLAIHRAALFDTLYKAAEGITLITGAKVTGETNGVLAFENGTKAGPFDLIVDASGAGSALSPLKARPLGFGAIWGNVDMPAAPPLPVTELRQRYRRANRMIGVMPVGAIPGEVGEKAAIFWSLPREGYAEWRSRGLDAWKAEAKALWPEFAPYLAGITDPDQMIMARYSHGTLRKPWRDRVVFIGDAAHRASPQLGQGANMALLDAWALALAIDLHGPRAAGSHYARARRWHIRAYQMTSRVFTPMYQSNSRILPVLRNHMLAPLSRAPVIRGMLTRLVRGDIISP